MPSSSPQPTVINSVDGIPLEGLLQAVTPSLGSVLLVHGFSVDMHEGGAFDRLAGRLGAAGVAVARVSFRGHGGSGGTQWGMTISGERLDLSAAYDWMTANCGRPTGLSSQFWSQGNIAADSRLTPSPCAAFVEPCSGTVQGIRQLAVSGPGNLDRPHANASAQGYVEVNRFKTGQVLLTMTCP
jgi:hypothetical protein